MRIRIWNAFASNNSGSYVIVGQFPREALAAEVAAELGAVARAHSAWVCAQRGQRTASESPLTAHAAELGLSYDADPWCNDWPPALDEPSVWAVGYQVFIHVTCTNTMPSALGHLLYEHGGRVATEIEHAHHPLVATFEIWFPRDTHDERLQDMVDALAAGPLAAYRSPSIAPAWRGRREGGGFEADLVVGAVLTDLAAGFTAIAAIVKRLGGQLCVRMSEALDGDGDPLAHLRPSAPPPTAR